MRDFRKPEFACPQCARVMQLITWLGEGLDKAIVECPICGIRETKNVVAETSRQEY